jgi:hypothetical protein
MLAACKRGELFDAHALVALDPSGQTELARAIALRDE